MGDTKKGGENSPITTVEMIRLSCLGIGAFAILVYLIVSVVYLLSMYNGGLPSTYHGELQSAYTEGAEIRIFLVLVAGIALISAYFLLPSAPKEESEEPNDES